MQKTQHGFRKKKSTAQAIHIIRRIIDTSNRAGINLNVVLLDWEKAFDKVSHEGLHIALDRMNIPPKLRSLIMQVYKNPKFKVEIDGIESNWKTQETGIRQGCPLSPYLFLIIMTVMFHDIHEDKELDSLLKEDQVIGAMIHELLYADDTIIYSRNPKTLSKLIAKIQTEGANYGLK